VLVLLRRQRVLTPTPMMIVLALLPLAVRRPARGGAVGVVVTLLLEKRRLVGEARPFCRADECAS